MFTCSQETACRSPLTGTSDQGSQCKVAAPYTSELGGLCAEIMHTAPHFRMAAEGRVQSTALGTSLQDGCTRHLTSKWRQTAVCRSTLSAPHFRMAAEGRVQKHCSWYLTSGWRQGGVCRSTALGTSLQHGGPRHLTSGWRQGAVRRSTALGTSLQHGGPRHLTSGWRQGAVCRCTALGTSL